MAYKRLPEIWKLLDERNFAEASKLLGAEFLRNNTPSRLEKLGELHLSFANHEQFTDYYRELSMDTAVITTSSENRTYLQFANRCTRTCPGRPYVFGPTRPSSHLLGRDRHFADPEILRPFQPVATVIV